uniref:Tape measure protein n=1 Tax=Pseudomonas phage Cygsa01 TaxID=3138529 RepID=A0AAU6W531_9VIRU
MAKPPRKAASTLQRDNQPAPQPVAQEPGTLTDVIARMQKQTQAQAEVDSKELTERIEATLMRSLDVQASNNKAAKRQNLKDLKAMRDELKMSKGMGDNQKEYEALFDKLIKQSVETSGIATKVATDLQQGILGKIPTIAGLVNLAGSNNPMIGMGLKLLSSASRNIAEAKRNASSERLQRLSNLKAEALATAEKLKRTKQDTMAPANDGPQVDRGDGRDQNGKFIKEGNATSLKQLDILIGIYERLGGTKEELEKSVAEQKAATRLALQAKAEAAKDRLQALENAKESKSKLIPLAANDDNGGKEKGGLLKHIAGEAIGNMVGRFIPIILGGLAGGLGTIAALFSKGGKFLKVAGKASGVIGLIMAAFDFFDGFSNAASILGKENPSFIDKVMSGFIAVWKGIAGIADTVAGLFGFDTNLAGMVEKGLATLYNNYMSGFYNAMADFITNGIKQIVAFGVSSVGLITEFFDGKKQVFKDLFQAVADFDIGEFMTGVKDGFKKKVEDMFTFVKDSIEDLLVSGIGSLIESLPEFARTDGMNDIVKRKNDIQTRKQAEKDPGFAKGYEKTSEDMKDEKAKKEAAATAAVVQQNNTNVSNNSSTTIGQPKISVGNPDQTAAQNLMTFGP